MKVKIHGMSTNKKQNNFS